jgi:flagellar protein FlbD
MVRLTRYDHQPIVVNGLLVCTVESVPDTFVTLMNGHRFHVRESVSEVVALVTAYHQTVYRGVAEAVHRDEGK